MDQSCHFKITSACQNACHACSRGVSAALLWFTRHVISLLLTVINGLHTRTYKTSFRTVDPKVEGSSPFAIQEKVTPLKDIEDMEDLWKGQLSTELQALDSATALLKDIEAKLNALGEADEKIKLLRTVPGVGPRLSEAVVAIIDDPHRFKNGRHVSSYLGMVPRRWQSGQVDITGRISKCGNKLLRTLLVEVSWLGLKEPWMREIYNKVKHGDKKRAKVAIVALARKLVVICWAMLKNETTFDADYAKRFAKC